ncbi:uncharacterized protein OCT59_001854 [Rhizophagus irregularis]|nr:hypothetical protein OCT59_001854 [Rhizophagus irregularis]GBC41066.1 hypothetical protein RIR_jg38578.t1 [Rhizophagus irregularis DAOM 181602=DAOM 197198]CAB5168937.1 unnamed protein product [Rhizophagus irregularis]
MDTSDSSISSSTTEIVNPSDGIQSKLTVATRSRGRKPKIPTGQSMSTTDQIQEIATQDTTTQKTTTTMVIEQLPPVADVTSSKQIPRQKRGRKPKNSSPEQPVGTEFETLQIREAATQDKETATQETTTMVIEQFPSDAAIASTSSIQQITRPKRGRKPKNSSPEQPVGTESETLQNRETATQDKETATQETTTMVIEQFPPDAAIASTSSIQQITRPKRGRKPKNSSLEQPVGTESALRIQETVTQNKETTTQETTTAAIEQLPPDTVMTSTSSTQQITRPKRGRKPKNSSPEQPVGTESETLQIRETATQDKETTTQETTTAAIEQLLPDTVMTSTSSTQQITRPKRGRKPKNSSPEQPVGTESETLRIQETVTQNKETTTQETTTAAIEQLPPDVAMISTSSTQQIPRSKRGRKPKNSSLEQPVGTESEILEQVTSINEQPAGIEEQLQSSSLPVVSIPKRERKLNETTAQITEEPTNVASTSASTTSQRGRKRKTVSESSTTADPDQMTSSNPKTNEEISEGNPPKRGRINVLEQELAEPVEATTEATKNRGKKRKTTTENDNGEREADPAKENKKSKKSKKPEEKRLARTRTICSTPIYERIIRAEQQRLYMVNREKIDDFHEEFAVLGSTGNIYTVTIKHVPNCTCPDFGKGNLCKHIFFIYLKVFRLNRDSSFIYQKALLSKELRSIFANAAPDPTVLANQRVRDKYKTFTSGELVSDTNGNENEKRRPIEGNCPICYEPLEEKDHKNIVWCKEGCGNNLHKDCFEQWKRSKRGDKVTCVYCRINWEESGSELLINEEGYVNLGDVQGMNTIRDTTSYYRKYRSWY